MQEGTGPRPFDTTTRLLIESDPAGWLSWIGLPADGPVQVLESDVSTVLAEVDKALRVDGPAPWLAHIEIQTGRDRRLPSRMLQYHALLHHRHDLRVESTVVLLRPEADGPDLSPPFELHGMTGDRTVAFWFRVVRLWERPAEELVQSGLGVLPLAPIAAVERERLPDLIRQMQERVEREAPPEYAGELWAAISLLMGLRYDDNETRHLLRGIRGMHESSVYQALLEEGREEGREQGREQGQLLDARQIVAELGTAKFGAPDAATRSLLERVSDVAALHRLAVGVLSASSWDDLLTLLPDR